MKTELTMEESLKREKGMIFPQDFSEKTLLAVAHSRNCIEALEKQIPMKPQEVLLAYGKGYECQNCGNELSVSEFDGVYCHWCGQKLDWEN